jgi:hypothetical protein
MDPALPKHLGGCSVGLPLAGLHGSVPVQIILLLSKAKLSMVFIWWLIRGRQPPSPPIVITGLVFAYSG